MAVVDVSYDTFSITIERNEREESVRGGWWAGHIETKVSVNDEGIELSKFSRREKLPLFIKNFLS